MNIEDLETNAKTLATDAQNDSRIVETKAESFVDFIKAHKWQALAITAVFVLVIAGLISHH